MNPSRSSRQSEPVEYAAYVGVRRVCEHAGCRNVITNFAAPKGEDPRTVPVWCRVHAYEARRRHDIRT